jgi:hypothetical protein
MNEMAQLYTNAFRAAGIDKTGEPGPMSVPDWEAIAPGLQETMTGRQIIQQREQEIQQFQAALAAVPENQLKSYSDVAAFYEQNTTPMIAGYAKELLKAYGGEPSDPHSRANLWMEEESRTAAQAEVDRLNAELGAPYGLTAEEVVKRPEHEPYTLVRTATGKWAPDRRQLSEPQKKAILDHMEERANESIWKTSPYAQDLTLREYARLKTDKEREAVVEQRRTRRAVTSFFGGELAFDELTPGAQVQIARDTGISEASQRALTEADFTPEDLESAQSAYGVSTDAASVYNIPAGGEQKMVSLAVKKFGTGAKLPQAVAASIKEIIPEGLSAEAYAKQFNTVIARASEEVRAEADSEIARARENALSSLVPLYPKVLEATKPLVALLTASDRATAYTIMNGRTTGIVLDANSTDKEISDAAAAAVAQSTWTMAGRPTSGLPLRILATQLDMLKQNPTSDLVPPPLQEAWTLYHHILSSGVADQRKRIENEDYEFAKKNRNELRLVMDTWEKHTGVPAYIQGTNGAVRSNMPSGLAWAVDGDKVQLFASLPLMNLYKNYSDGTETGKANQDFLRKAIGFDPKTGIIGGTVGPNNQVVSTLDPVMEQILVAGLEGRDFSEISDPRGFSVFSEAAIKTMRNERAEIDLAANAKMPIDPLSPRSRLNPKRWFGERYADQPLSRTLVEGAIEAPLALYMKTKDARYWWLARASAQYVAQQAEMSTVKAIIPRIRKAGANLLWDIGAITQDNVGRFIDLDGRPVQAENPEQAVRVFKTWQEKMRGPEDRLWQDPYYDRKLLMGEQMERRLILKELLDENGVIAAQDRLEKTLMAGGSDVAEARSELDGWAELSRLAYGETVFGAEPAFPFTREREAAKEKRDSALAAAADASRKFRQTSFKRWAADVRAKIGDEQADLIGQDGLRELYLNRIETGPETS